MKTQYQRQCDLEAKLVDLWNQKHTTPTPVRYWPGVKEGKGKLGITRGKAELLGGHTAVVWIQGVAGCVALSHVQAIAEGA